MSVGITRGGMANTSAFGFSAVLIIHTKGKSQSNATRRRNPWDMSWLSGIPLVRALSIVDPPFLDEELDRGDGHDDDEEDPGKSRGIAHLEELESVVIEVQHQGRRADAGSATGEDVGLREDLE